MCITVATFRELLCVTCLWFYKFDSESKGVKGLGVRY